MRTVVAVLRIVVALVAAVAIVATLLDTASRASINPFNFFGFFTIQGNIIALAALLATGAAGLSSRRQSKNLVLFRACATTYIVVVGVVYSTLLAGLEGGVSLPWANFVLHVALPIYAALDWILIPDRKNVPWHRFWIVLVYPAVWLVVVLVRGATDGWVPYPFLDPGNGYGVVAGYAVGIAVAISAAGAAVWGVSRWQLPMRSHAALVNEPH
jgi:hypothetical protein